MSSSSPSIRSYLLVASQFIWIGALMLTMDWSHQSFLVWIWQGTALLLGLWGVLTMKLGHFNIVPDPQPTCQLVEHGPYRWIRHPMYASLLYFFAPALFQGLLPAMFYLFLTLTLLLKLHYEECLLCAKLQAYPSYCQRSKKLIPFLY